MSNEKQRLCLYCRLRTESSRRGDDVDLEPRATVRGPSGDCMLHELFRDVLWETYWNSGKRHFDRETSLRYSRGFPRSFIGILHTDFTIHAGQDWLGPFFAIKPCNKGNDRKWEAHRGEFRLRPLELRLSLTTPVKDLAVSESKHLVQPAATPCLRGRPLSIGRVKSWLWQCEKRDGELCHSKVGPERHRSSIDLIFVDVLQERLVNNDSSDQYVALSYVWGQTRTLRTKKDNLAELQEPGAVSDHDPSIAMTIRDAIKFTRDLGFQFLWVDCLSIVQDDANEKHRQIREMDIVYSQAHLTIVAACGQDANHGLPGVRQGSRDIPTRPAITLGGVPFGFLRSLPTFREEFAQSHLRTRAWTFQERLLSRRCLYFFPEQVFFCCASASDGDGLGGLGEDVKRRQDRDRIENPFLPLLLLETADSEYIQRNFHDGYCATVEAYTKTQLSYPEDMLDAFSGIIALIQRALEKSGLVGTVLSGIPEAYIHAHLLWTPEDSGQDLVRRQPPIFPSWTWAGWIGPATYEIAFGRDILVKSSLLMRHDLGYILTDDVIKSLMQNLYAGFHPPFLKPMIIKVAYTKQDWEFVRGMLHFMARTIPSSSLDYGEGRIRLSGMIHPYLLTAERCDAILISECLEEYFFMLIAWQANYSGLSSPAARLERPEYAERIGLGWMPKPLWPLHDETYEHIILN